MHTKNRVNLGILFNNPGEGGCLDLMFPCENFLRI